MLRFLLGIPSFLVSLVWSVLFPAKAQPRPAGGTVPPAPDPDAPSAESIEVGHETTDASAKVIGLFVVGLFSVIFLTMAVLAWVYARMYTTDSAMPVRIVEQTFRNAPRAKTSIARDWATIDAAAKQRLEAYSWADPGHTVVRVPVTRAMDLVAGEGLPARPGQAPDFGAPEQQKLPLMQLESDANALSFDPH